MVTGSLTVVRDSITIVELALTIVVGSLTVVESAIPIASDPLEPVVLDPPGDLAKLEEALRRFESTGQVSLQHLLELAFALNRLNDFDALLQPLRASSIAELEAAEKHPPRRRDRV